MGDKKLIGKPEVALPHHKKRRKSLPDSKPEMNGGLSMGSTAKP
jgi:hypothetical protein